MLSAEHIALLQGAVSINVASCDGNGLPSVSRAFGCKVTDDNQVRVFLFPVLAEELLRDIRNNGKIAIVFSRPSTHETIQLKSSHGRVQALAPGDIDTMTAYRGLIAEELKSIGFSQGYAEALIPPPVAAAVAIQFRPEQWFLQTPGPRAGEKISV